MSKYTTGEIATLCGITVRTVQYYDTRGILTPSELTEGGRRMYSEQDLRRMKIICFLRELDLPIDSIKQLLAEENSANVISLLLDRQEEDLKKDIAESEERLRKLEDLKSGLKSYKEVSVESIGDIERILSNKIKLKKIYRTLFLTGIPVMLLQWTAIILGIIKGWWWLFAVWVVVGVVFGIWATNYYYKRVAYICPECHTVFQPALKEMFFAAHTPTTRKLTCTACGHKGFCVEVAKEES